MIKRTHCYISEFCSRERAFLRCISLTFDRCQVATRRLGSRPIAWVLEIRSSWPARPRTPTTNKPKRPKQGSKICFKQIYIYLNIIYRLVNIICNDDISNVNIYVKSLIVIMFHVLFYFEIKIFWVFFFGVGGVPCQKCEVIEWFEMIGTHKNLWSIRVSSLAISGPHPSQSSPLPLVGGRIGRLPGKWWVTIGLQPVGTSSPHVGPILWTLNPIKVALRKIWKWTRPQRLFPRVLCHCMFYPFLALPVAGYLFLLGFPALSTRSSKKPKKWFFMKLCMRHQKYVSIITVYIIIYYSMTLTNMYSILKQSEKS